MLAVAYRGFEWPIIEATNLTGSAMQRLVTELAYVPVSKSGFCGFDSHLGD